jgi:hypothetical protein
MKDHSIRQLTEVETHYLEMVMGYNTGALKGYIGRWVIIKLDSPHKVTSSNGNVKYRNDS